MYSRRINTVPGHYPLYPLESIPVFGRRKTVPVSLLEHVLLLTLNILLYVTFLNVYYMTSATF
jgi:hypothetical protein